MCKDFRISLAASVYNSLEEEKGWWCWWGVLCWRRWWWLGWCWWWQRVVLLLHLKRVECRCDAKAWMFCLVVLLPCCIAAQCSALVGNWATRRPKPWVTPPPPHAHAHAHESHLPQRSPRVNPDVGHAEICSSQLSPQVQLLLLSHRTYLVIVMTVIIMITSIVIIMNMNPQSP